MLFFDFVLLPFLQRLGASMAASALFFRLLRIIIGVFFCSLLAANSASSSLPPAIPASPRFTYFESRF